MHRPPIKEEEIEIGDGLSDSLSSWGGDNYSRMRVRCWEWRVSWDTLLSMTDRIATTSLSLVVKIEAPKKMMGRGYRIRWMRGSFYSVSLTSSFREGFEMKEFRTNGTG